MGSLNNHLESPTFNNNLYFIIIKMKTNDENYGVYLIKNLVNNKRYIGSTIQSFKIRCKKHINESRIKQYPIYKAIRKYGIENFEFQIIKSFSSRKNNNTKILKIVRYLEEKYINIWNPEYNVCKFPTRNGLPNLNRKLSEEWKNNIRIKSLQYLHSKQSYKKVKENNENNQSLYVLYNIKTFQTYSGSAINLRVLLLEKYNIELNSIIYDNTKSNWMFKKLIKQSKSITLIDSENNNYRFNSYNLCDKFLNKWRGYTSTQLNRNPNLEELDGYKIILNEDIV